MSHLLRKLHHLKEKKQELALRAMQAKHRDVDGAKRSLAAAQDALHHSTATYNQRVDALYAPILGKTTDLAAIEDIESRIAQIDLDHERLTENVHEATDHLEDLEDQLGELTQAYAEAARTTTKFQELLESITAERRKEEERREEIENEEGFTSLQEIME